MENTGGTARRAALLASGVATLCALLLPGLAPAAILPPGFHETQVFSELTEPTALGFAPDGKTFVAEKPGKIVVYDSTDDSTPTEFADLRSKVFAAGDRGLLGLAVDPEFPTEPYVYALYTYDHELGEPGEGPRWNDFCPNPPGLETNGCVVSGRLVRLKAEGDHAISESVLVEDWCQQFGSHSLGSLRFGPDGSLYASAGDGANFNVPDFGQFGYPSNNPCGDPPGGVGGSMSSPSAEGGSLRSQDALTSADPQGLDGSLIRIDPITGEGLPGNPMFESSDPNRRRVIAYGFRNPFRFTIDPVSDEVYVGNVGQEDYEEIDRFNTRPEKAYNSGWPCYEGTEPYPPFAGLGLALCERLYRHPEEVALPFFKYDHYEPVVPGDGCDHSRGSVITGMASYRGGNFPSSYEGALFFSDGTRQCIFVMFPGEDGRPDPSTVIPFMTDGGLYPGTDLVVGPDGDLYEINLYGAEYGPGSIHRISYSSGDQPPTADLAADREWGEPPLTVTFDATHSTDADGDPLTYEWDLDGDGVYSPATKEAIQTETYEDDQNHLVSVRVKDPDGQSSVARVTVYPGDTPPEVAVYAPSAGLEWSVGDEIYFEGGAEDNEDGPLPPNMLDWTARILHCPESCHVHPLGSFPSVSSGTLIAPEHEYPSQIQLTLTAVDYRGLAARKTVSLTPETADLTLSSDPPGLTLTAGEKTSTTPFTVRFIKGSTVGVSAPRSQAHDGSTYEWKEWSDEEGRIHSIFLSGPAALTAIYKGPGIRVEEPAPTAVARAPRITRLRHRFVGRLPHRRVRVIFVADQGDATFRCKVDAQPFRPCTSPVHLRARRVGTHIFTVFAVSADGRRRSLGRTFHWVDHGRRR